MRKIFLITDMDGTLLPKNKVINPKDTLAIQKLLDMGGMFSVATGRSLNSAAQYFGDLCINAPVVLFNGGLVYDTHSKKSVMCSCLHETALDVTKMILDRFSSLGAEIDTVGFTYVVQTNPEEEHHIEISYKNDEYAKANLSDVPNENIMKILFADEPQNIDILMKYIDEKKFPNLDFVRSSSTYLEMLPYGCSKGSALDWIKKNYKLDDYLVVACGDYYNDTAMLETADVGVAPQNALECVKTATDYIAKSTCDDGFIAETIEYVLNMCEN